LFAVKALFRHLERPPHHISQTTENGTNYTSISLSLSKVHSATYLIFKYPSPSLYPFNPKMRPYYDASELPRSLYLNETQRYHNSHHNCALSPRLSEARSGPEKERKDAATKKEGKDGGGKEAQAVKDERSGKAGK
jgi:hypothetical protein